MMASTHPNNPWTSEIVEKMKALHAEGLSARKIGEQIGMSRCAVLGKVLRLGLAKKVSNKAIIQKVTQTPTRQRQIYRPGFQRPVYDLEQIILPPPLVEPLNIKLTDAQAGQCRWIQDDDDLICGHPVSKTSWCAYHHAIVFKKREVKQVRRPVMRFAATEFV